MPSNIAGTTDGRMISLMRVDCGQPKRKRATSSSKRMNAFRGG